MGLDLETDPESVAERFTELTLLYGSTRVKYDLRMESVRENWLKRNN